MRNLLCVSLLAASAALSALVWSGHAAACGGCFIPPPMPGEVGTVVTAHRMALSVSTQRTILWDQIQYSGNPAEFAWVLPVKPGARIEVGSQAFFDVLDAATGTQVIPPLLECKSPGAFGCSVVPGVSSASFGCSASGADTGGPNSLPDPVDVVSHGAAGPYEQVILHSDVPGALSKWLQDHNYAIPNDVIPVIEAYQKEGFDFAALRLLPSSGIQQMRPVRVISPGASPVLPLRMVAAGTGPQTAITLFVIGEGRYEAANLPTIDLPRNLIVWDYLNQSSNYASIRDTYYGHGGLFFTAYSMPGALFEAVVNPATRSAAKYRTTNGWQFATIADAYVEQAFVDGATSSTDCRAAFLEMGEETRRVGDYCDSADPDCLYDENTEIDPRRLECDPPLGSDIPLDDLAQALVGMHPSDVWVTRLEANLTRPDLANDLSLQAAPRQESLNSSFVAGDGKNVTPTCRMLDSAAVTDPNGQNTKRDGEGGGDGGGLGRLAPALFLGALGLLLGLRRLVPGRRPSRGLAPSRRARGFSVAGGLEVAK